MMLIIFQNSQIRPLLDKLEEMVCDGASDDALSVSFKPYKHFAQDAAQILLESASHIDAAVQDLQVKVFTLFICVSLLKGNAHFNRDVSWRLCSTLEWVAGIL